MQEIVQLPPGFGSVKVTVAHFWRPSGKDINRPHRPEDSGDGAAKTDVDGDWGVMPDSGYEVRMDAKQRERLNRWRIDQHLRSPEAEKQPPTDKPAAKPESATDVDPQLAKAAEYVRGQVGQ